MIEERRVGLSRIGVERVATGPYADHDLLRALIREAAYEAGLGESNQAVPLADIISPGATVLLKPNWVHHENYSGAGMDCMVTHPAFILAALEEVLAARPARVIIGDAPIQKADFDRLVTPDWRRKVQAAAGGTPVQIVDLRNTTASLRRGVLAAQCDCREPERLVMYDLGTDSLLEDISRPAGHFRVTNYDSAHLARVQAPGLHQFLLCKEPFEADVVLSLPKLKAHAKAGVTGALKNLVGLNGDKNFLPHHRVGGSVLGGDCYPGLKPFKRLAEYFLDLANHRIGHRSYPWLVLAAGASNAVHGGDLEGRWLGNDTCWRTVLDLNRILQYGDVDGVMHETPQRRVYALTDAIIAGDRNGPLAPEPVRLGAVTFASSAPHADAAHLALMGFDPRCVPLVREAHGDMRWRLTEAAMPTVVHVAGRAMSLDEVAKEFGVCFRPPAGWAGVVRAS